MRTAVTALIGFGVFGSGALVIPPLLLGVVRRASPRVVFSVPVEERVVALTIDDGPSSSTAEILEVLDAHESRATFFLIGENVDRAPETARRIIDSGHEAAHHMMRNEPSIRLPAAEFDAQFEAMDRRLIELGGVRLFRPGSGWYDEDMVQAVEARGYRLVLGDVYPFDAHIPFTSFLSWYILRNVAPGSIIVLHDGAGRGRRTAEVLRAVLPELRRRGYRVVTATELLEPAAPSVEAAL